MVAEIVGYRALESASEIIRNDCREVALVIVKNEGLSLEIIAEKLRSDREMVLQAVKSHPHAL